MVFVCIDEIVKRIEDLLTALEFVIGDLKELAGALKKFVAECRSMYEITVETVRRMIPGRLQAYLGLSEDEEYVTVNVKRPLNAEQFKAVVEVVVGRLGGEYVSLGGTGYFRIPKGRLQTSCV